MATSANNLSPRDYRIACICPMAKEFAAVRGMLDANHMDILIPNSRNAYAFGEIGAHNIVIAIMPNIGNNRAAAIANQLLNDFPIIDLALLVGIGGGIPTDKIDIRLGDVVVGKKSNVFGAVVQYDLVQLAHGMDIKPASILTLPSPYYMGRVELLNARHRNEGADISRHISQMLSKYPTMRKQHYGRPEGARDLFFPANVLHTGGADCGRCDLTKAVKRSDRPDREPEIHYGTIASGAFVLKDATLRDRLAKELGACCIEMEAAGVSQDLSCLVVRGVSDYADNHKHDGWQQYAAATAAAYVKELLLSIPAINNTTKPVQQNDFSQDTHLGPSTLPIDRLSLSSSPTGSEDKRGELLSTNLDQFVGRKEELGTMWRALQPRTRASQHQVLALQGRSGVGKTQLLNEYARLYATEYSLILRLDASTEDELQASLQSAYLNALKGPALQDPGLQTHTISARFDSYLSEKFGSRWLLVFEGYDDPMSFDIERYYPSKSLGSIIVTTVSSGLEARSNLCLTNFTNNRDSLTLLAHTSGNSEISKDPRSWDLLFALEGFPIAISIAGAYLKRSKLTCGQFFRAWNTHCVTATNSGQPAGFMQVVLYSVCDLCIKTIQESSFTAFNLLKLLAYFDHRDISFDLIAAGRYSEKPNKPSWYIEVASYWARFELAMQVLVDFRLVQVNAEKRSYSIHSCVHEWICSLMGMNTDESFFRIAFECVANMERSPAPQSGGLVTESPVLRHALRLSDPRFSTYIQHQDCYYTSKIAFILGKNLQVEQSAQLYTIALSRFSNEFAEQTNVSLLSMSNLAIQYDSTDRSEYAISFLNQALLVYQDLRKTDTIDMIRVMHCLARMYLKKGDFVQAQATCDRAYQKCEKYLPQYHELRLAIYLNSRCLSHARKNFNTKGKSFKPARVRQSTLRGALHSTTIGIASAVCAMCSGQDQLLEIVVMVEVMITESVRGAEASGDEPILARNMLPLATSTLLYVCRSISESRNNQNLLLLLHLMRITNLMDRTQSTAPDPWEHLSEALFLCNDIVHARVARDLYLMYELGTNDSFMNCDRCKRKSLDYKTGRFICTKCRDVDLCSGCARDYQNGTKILETCHNHQIIDRLKYCTPRTDEIRAGIKVQENPMAWLRRLCDEYFARSKELVLGHGRSPHLVLPDVERLPAIKEGGSR